MARKIFFSFHYERDAWRAGQVRNSNVVSSDDRYGFIDAVDWESIKKQGDEAVRRWIVDQLKDTSVTVVLIGAETANREWVRHEILKSWNRGNGLVGVRIHNVKHQDGNTDYQGRNPFDDFKLSDGRLLSSVCKTFDWVLDDGRTNLGKWADEAAEIRAKYGKDDKIGETGGVEASGLSASIAAPATVGFVPRSPWCSYDGK
jgi:hypothetical protein